MAAPVSTLTDFTSPIWSQINGDHGLVSATPTTLTMTGDPDWAAGLFTGYDYSLDESRVFMKVAQLPTTGFISGEMYDPDNAWYYWKIFPNLSMVTTVYRVGATNPTWNPAKPFISIRETGGRVYFEVSATGNPGTWETIYSDVPAYPLDGLTFDVYIDSGSTGTAVVTNLNTPTVTGGGGSSVGSKADKAKDDLTTAGFTTGSIADRELAYLTSKTAVGKTFADKAVALGKKPLPHLGTYP